MAAAFSELWEPYLWRFFFYELVQLLRMGLTLVRLSPVNLGLPLARKALLDWCIDGVVVVVPADFLAL